jgi:RNA polymerase sigma-70 factor (ECF subfamily)
VSQDDEGQDDEELAAFAALGGRLTWDELARLLGHGDGQALSRALLTLPFRQRQVIELCKYQGLSERQAAEVMRISIGALRSHLSRGMLSLRCSLAP